MRGRRIRPDRAAVLARTADLEMQLGIGNPQDTIGQLSALLDELHKARQTSRTAEDALIATMRQQIAKLQAAIHRRELQFDQQEGHIIRLREELARLGSTVR